MPYRDFFRQITPLVDRVGTDMAAGAGPALMSMPVELSRVVDAAVGICFEVAYADLIREGVLASGELIIIPTTTPPSVTPQSRPSDWRCRASAVEHGRATIQISTVGISGVIMPDGAMTQRSGLFTAEELTATLPLRTTLTPAARLGAAPEVTAWVLAAARRDGRPTGPPHPVHRTVPHLRTPEYLATGHAGNPRT
ncbi:hypothetical protein [Ornithinimicrobium sufpigmenti]|uniref:hypothetical protein n=1 Tax=Ornithinimicrobium sufpigmenti TaxID=2508882 RepID=UPI0010359C06|nr:MULTISPECIES: hypothetical protein [unclassified Ornithinimicrobium]